MTASAKALLTVAAVLVGIEALGYLAIGILEFSGGLFGLGFGVGVMFSAAGLGLLIAAWAIRRAGARARAPIIVAQLLQLLVARDIRPEGLERAMPVLLVALALVVLVCLLSPPVTRALSGERPV